MSSFGRPRRRGIVPVAIAAFLCGVPSSSPAGESKFPSKNQPPQLSLASKVLVVDEGQVATNRITFSDPEGQLVRLSTTKPGFLELKPAHDFGNVSGYVQLGDMDGDGDLDAVFRLGRVALNDGAGTFGALSGWLVPSNGNYYVDLHDLDNDGDLDAILSGKHLAFNDGTGRLDLGGELTGSMSGGASAFGDLNGDGDLDAAGGDGVWIGDGTGAFIHRPGGFEATGLNLIGDVDGDTDLDLIRGNRVFKNDGTGVFEFAHSIRGSSWRSSALGDLDLDGDLDLFYGRWEPDEVWFNDGSGFFSDSEQRIGEDETHRVRLADADGDGDLDVWIVNRSTDSRLWLTGGRGQLIGSAQPGTRKARDLAVGDVNGDGAQDAVVVNANGYARVWTASVQETAGIRRWEWATDDGPSHATVSISAGDSRRSASVATFEVWVQNVVPSILVAPQGAFVGIPHSFSLGSFTDPGRDAPWAVTVDWGDGSPIESFTAYYPGGLGRLEHTYADVGSPTAVISVTEDGGRGAGSSAEVIVQVVDPVPALNSPLPSGAGVADYAISPDSSRVIYLADQNVDEVFELFGRLVDYPVPPIRLNTPLPPELSVERFEIRGDGTRVVYRETGGRLISTLASGGFPVSLAESSTRFEVAPDGRRVVFALPYFTESDGLIISIPTEGGPTKRLDSIPYPYCDCGPSSNFVISPDGQWVGYTLWWTEGASNYQTLSWTAIDGIGGGRYTDRILGWMWVGDGSPLVLPTHGQLLGSGGLLEAYPTQFAPTPEPVNGDYRAVYIDAFRRLFSVSLQGGAPTLLDDSLDVRRFDISPDGRWVAYDGNGPPARLVRSYGGNSLNLPSVAASKLDFSPDSQWVLLRSPNALVAVPITGGPSRLLNSPAIGVVSQYAFKPDGSSIAFIENRQGRFELFEVPLAAGVPVKRNAGFLHAEADVLDFKWSPDGNFIVYRADGNLDEQPELFKVPAGRPLDRIHENQNGSAGIPVASPGEW